MEEVPLQKCRFRSVSVQSSSFAPTFLPDLLTVKLHIFKEVYSTFKHILFHSFLILADVVIKERFGIIALLCNRDIYGSFWRII